MSRYESGGTERLNNLPGQFETLVGLADCSGSDN